MASIREEGKEEVDGTHNDGKNASLASKQAWNQLRLLCSGERGRIRHTIKIKSRYRPQKVPLHWWIPAAATP